MSGHDALRRFYLWYNHRVAFDIREEHPLGIFLYNHLFPLILNQVPVDTQKNIHFFCVWLSGWLFFLNVWPNVYSRTLAIVTSWSQRCIVLTVLTVILYTVHFARGISRCMHLLQPRCVSFCLCTGVPEGPYDLKWSVCDMERLD